MYANKILNIMEICFKFNFQISTAFNNYLNSLPKSEVFEISGFKTFISLLLALYNTVCTVWAGDNNTTLSSITVLYTTYSG